jgi:hypothetical protein
VAGGIRRFAAPLRLNSLEADVQGFVAAVPGLHHILIERLETPLWLKTAAKYEDLE